MFFVPVLRFLVVRFLVQYILEISFLVSSCLRNTMPVSNNTTVFKLLYDIHNAGCNKAIQALNRLLNTLFPVVFTQQYILANVKFTAHKNARQKTVLYLYRQCVTLFRPRIFYSGAELLPT